MVWISPDTLSFTSLVTVKIWFKYLVPKALAERAKFVKEAKTAKKVALRCEGAFLQSKLIKESLIPDPMETLKLY